MLCYRDKTFCSETHCANYECQDNLTPEKTALAQLWWNGTDPVEEWTSAPIAMQPMKDTDMCPGYKERKKHDKS